MRMLKWKGRKVSFDVINSLPLSCLTERKVSTLFTFTFPVSSKDLTQRRRRSGAWHGVWIRNGREEGRAFSIVNVSTYFMLARFHFIHLRKPAASGGWDLVKVNSEGDIRGKKIFHRLSDPKGTWNTDLNQWEMRRWIQMAHHLYGIDGNV